MTTATLPDFTPAHGTNIPYATPAARPGARAWAGVGILLGGLALIGLGGCFLIGVLSVVSPGVTFNAPQPSTLTGPQAFLMCVLYALAFACFAGAAVMMVVGTRGLLRVMRA